MKPEIKELPVGTPDEFSPTAMMARARMATIIQKTGRFTWGSIFVGMIIVMIAGFFKNELVMVYGFVLAGGGMGGSMTLDAILYQLQTGGILESQPRK